MRFMMRHLLIRALAFFLSPILRLGLFVCLLFYVNFFFVLHSHPVYSPIKGFALKLPQIIDVDKAYLPMQTNKTKGNQRRNGQKNCELSCSVYRSQFNLNFNQSAQIIWSTFRTINKTFQFFDKLGDMQCMCKNKMYYKLSITKR